MAATYPLKAGLTYEQLGNVPPQADFFVVMPWNIFEPLGVRLR